MNTQEMYQDIAREIVSHFSIEDHLTKDEIDTIVEAIRAQLLELYA